MPPEYSKECECWSLSMCSLSHLTRHTYISKEAPSGNQDINLHQHTDAAFAKYHSFISQTLTNSWSPLASISSLWYLWAKFLFQIKSLLRYKNTWEMKICCHRTSADFSFQCGHQKMSGEHFHPLHTGKEKSGFIVFKFKKQIKTHQIFPLRHKENKAQLFLHLWMGIGKTLLSLTIFLVRSLFSPSFQEPYISL